MVKRKDLIRRYSLSIYWSCPMIKMIPKIITEIPKINEHPPSFTASFPIMKEGFFQCKEELVPTVIIFFLIIDRIPPIEIRIPGTIIHKI